jgi:hypothetical protein
VPWLSFRQSIDCTAYRPPEYVLVVSHGTTLTTRRRSNLSVAGAAQNTTRDAKGIRLGPPELLVPYVPLSLGHRETSTTLRSRFARNNNKDGKLRGA